MNLYLFYKSIDETLKCMHPMVNGLIVDLERRGKDQRQTTYNTQINRHTIDDLILLRKYTDLPIIVRINGFPFFDKEELVQCIGEGADEILLPMVRRGEQIEKVLESSAEKFKLGILAETNDAIAAINELSQFDLSRIYVGLNDLCIDRKSANIFKPLIDGTIESIRNKVTAPFGYAGLTHTQLGSPIQCKLILQNLLDNKTDFTFLRRSFYEALFKYKPEHIFESIKEEIINLEEIDSTESVKMKEELIEKIKTLNATDSARHTQLQ